MAFAQPLAPCSRWPVRVRSSNESLRLPHFPRHSSSFIVALLNRDQTSPSSITTLSPGVFWPCAIEYLDSPVTAMTYAEDAHTLLVGLAHGQVLLYTVPRDYNALTLSWRAHGMF